MDNALCDSSVNSVLLRQNLLPLTLPMQTPIMALRAGGRKWLTRGAPKEGRNGPVRPMELFIHSQGKKPRVALAAALRKFPRICAHTPTAIWNDNLLLLNQCSF